MKEKYLMDFNRRLLTSQLLVERAAGSGALSEIAKSCCGVNSQNLRDSYHSFWARSESFSDEKLKRALGPNGDLVRTWTVRGTVHTFPLKDYYTHVFGSPRNRALKSHDNYARQLGLPDREKRIDLLYQPLLDEINGHAVSSNFIGEFISERLVSLGFKGKMKLNRGWTSEPKYGPVWKGITEMSYLGLIVGAGKKGAESLWMSTAHRLNSKVKVPDPEDCAVKLIRSYVEKYGPVSFSDICYWSGHRKKEVQNALTELGNDLAMENYGIKDDPFYSLNGFKKDDQEVPEAIILPRFDSLIMGHMDKSRFMNPAHKNRVSVNAGIINPTVLVNGFVAGVWRKEKAKKGIRVSVSAFRELKPNERASISERFVEFGDYLNTDVSVRYRISK